MANVGRGVIARSNDRRGFVVANAEVEGVPCLDVRCRDGRIVEIGRDLEAGADEATVDARGGALLPGLNDHHIHLFALAAARRSIQCGPPSVTTRAELKAALEAAPGDDWIRGVGYHESVAGMLDLQSLDALRDDRPIRIQHRSGKAWFLNSPAERRLGIESANGRLFRQDDLLRKRLHEDADLFRAVEETSGLLAGYGVTGVTDATYTNDASTVDLFRRLELEQRVNLMGDESLDSGSLKIMLDEDSLPTLDRLRSRIERAHRRSRPVAIHCVTRTELVFALAALRDAGTVAGDRMEHAAVADPPTLALMKEVCGDERHLSVVTQPNFIAERGDRYLEDVPTTDHGFLYRGRGFVDAGIPLGGGTDAPFGNHDPWAAMRAAVERRTVTGNLVGDDEGLTAEQALALFTTPLSDPGGNPTRVAVGENADFCLLDRPWSQARTILAKELVVPIRETTARGS